MTATDTKDGNVSIKCLPQQCKFVGIAFAVRPVGHQASFLAVEAGIDVDTAGEEQAAGVSGKVFFLNDEEAGAPSL